MAFSELDLKRIDKLVGGLCRRRTHPQRADELRFIYEVAGHNVILSEERPDWRDSNEQISRPFAKLRFVRTTGLWSLYWMRADSKWHRYEPAAATPDLAALLDVIDGDQYCAFFG
jgi:hypothetical protein